MELLLNAAAAVGFIMLVLFALFVIAGFIDLLRHVFGDKKNTTPVTSEGLKKYDHLPPMQAAVKAWTTPGNNPQWDAKRKDEVRRGMPLLARALDRAVWDHYGPNRYTKDHRPTDKD